MIVSIWGVPGLSFAELTYMLTSMGVGFMAASDKKTIKVGQPATDRVVPVVFSSVKEFAKHRLKIKFRAVVFVCDAYSRLNNELGWPLVGVKDLGKGQHEYTRFDREELKQVLRDADKLRQEVPINMEVSVYNPTEELIEKFEDSALSASSTLMYKIKDQELRAKTSVLVRGYFMGDVKSSDMLYTKLKAIHSNAVFVDAMVNILTSKTGLALRKIVIVGKTQPEKIDALSRKAKISPFDIRYLLSATAKKK